MGKTGNGQVASTHAKRLIAQEHAQIRANLRTSFVRMKTASRSNMSTSASVTSPCTKSSMPASAIAFSAGRTRIMSVTPESELVVAPAQKQVNSGIHEWALS